MISHGCFRGSYRGLGELRVSLAEAAGLPPWYLMEGVWDPEDNELVRRAQPFFAVWKGGVPIPWEPYDKDPLCIFLEHEDDRGIIAPDDAAKLATRLEELMPKIKAEYHKVATKQLVAGLRDAAKRGERVVFT